MPYVFCHDNLEGLIDGGGSAAEQLSCLLYHLSVFILSAHYEVCVIVGLRLPPFD